MRCVAVNGDDHWAGRESDFGIRVCARIVAEWVHWMERIGCGFSLGCSEAAQGYKHGAVDFSCIVQESDYYFLEVRDLGCSKIWGLVRGCSELDFGAVLRGVTELW
jgi:hypothetical protein